MSRNVKRKNENERDIRTYEPSPAAAPLLDKLIDRLRKKKIKGPLKSALDLCVIGYLGGKKAR